MSATDRSDVWNAGVDAILEIGAAGVIGCIVTMAESQIVTIVASTWPRPWAPRSTWSRRTTGAMTDWSH